ncbi:MAG: hypothetical protein P8012_03850 [Desulfobacterales bacterium]
MNYLISMFIDNELDINEKISFIEIILKNKLFKDETLQLLHQEKLLRGEVVEHIPAVQVKVPFHRKRFLRPFFQPMGLVASALAAIVIFLIFSIPSPKPSLITKRFVIYRPDVSQVEIAGDFTDWKRIPMQRIGNSGYWEISFELMKGEHRFSYILEGRQPFADPTILAREPDDFGNEDSIFYVG